MNLALFVTQANHKTLPDIVRAMAASQHELVNGALIVIHDSLLSREAIAFTLDLATRFKVSASLPVQVNASHSESDHLAAMFSALLTTAYSRYPGPWLLFDEPALPKAENWMQEALRQHGAYGSRMTGRATTHPGSTRPVGPVTLELDFKTLKFLRFPTRQNWRERGQFLFARHGFQLVPADQWLFSLEKVEAIQPELRFGPVSVNKSWDELSDKELIAVINASGKKPHHFTGRDKLLSMARELQATPA